MNFQDIVTIVQQCFVSCKEGMFSEPFRKIFPLMEAKHIQSLYESSGTWWKDL